MGWKKLKFMKYRNKCSSYIILKGVTMFNHWLVVEPTPLKNMSQNGNLPQIGMKIKNLWNHHLESVHFSGGVLIKTPTQKQKKQTPLSFNGFLFSGLRSLLQVFMKVNLPNVAILFPYHLYLPYLPWFGWFYGKLVGKYTIHGCYGYSWLFQLTRLWRTTLLGVSSLVILYNKKFSWECVTSNLTRGYNLIEFVTGLLVG